MGRTADPTGRQWSVAQAKARLSEVIERAETDGPQVIARNGKPKVVVVPLAQWTSGSSPRPAAREPATPSESFADFLMRSPLRESGLLLERPDDPPREAAIGVDD